MYVHSSYGGTTNFTLVELQPVATMLQYRLYDGRALPANLEGFVKAGANIGSVIGQFAFGTRILIEVKSFHHQSQDTRPTHLGARLFVSHDHIVPPTT